MIRRNPSSRYCVYCQRQVTLPHMCSDEVKHNELSTSINRHTGGDSKACAGGDGFVPHKTYRALTPRQMERERLRRRQ